MSSRLRSALEIQLDVQMMSDFYPEERLIFGQEVRPNIIIDGREILQFASLDYLGLATDERVIEAGVRALRKYGVGALASRLVSDLDIHREMELKLAEFMGTEDSVVFTSGSSTNIGVIPAVIASPLTSLCPGSNPGAERAVFVDALAHASANDGIQLARGARLKRMVYHDIEQLTAMLETCSAEIKLIVTDGIFSTTGQVAPLAEICDLAAKFNAIIYVDDSHAIGVLGANGRGTCELLGVEDKVDIKMGVISKALGTMGGFVAGDSWFIQYLRHSRPQIHSMPLPPAESAATIKAIEIAQAEPWRREKILHFASILRAGFQEIGYNILGSTTQVVPILVGDELTARKFADELFEKWGIFCPPFEYPAVPKGQAVLRFCPSAIHKEKDIGRLLEALSELYRDQKYSLKLAA